MTDDDLEEAERVLQIWGPKYVTAGVGLTLVKALRDCRRASDALREELARERALRDVDYLLSGHRCRPVARMSMGANRDWWLGELVERLPEWPSETHCLHIATPLKAVVLGINAADMTQMAVLAQIVHGEPINPEWITRMERVLRKRATALAAVPEAARDAKPTTWIDPEEDCDAWD